MQSFVADGSFSVSQLSGSLPFHPLLRSNDSPIDDLFDGAAPDLPRVLDTLERARIRLLKRLSLLLHAPPSSVRNGDSAFIRHMGQSLLGTEGRHADPPWLFMEHHGEPGLSAGTTTSNHEKTP